MKLLRHGPKGTEKPGLVAPDGSLRDLSGHAPDIAGAVLSDAGLAALRGIDPSGLPEIPAGTRLGPCVGGTGKFMCIGLNYADHAAESGMAVPCEPVLFMKATSAICGPCQAPLESRAEGEWWAMMEEVFHTDLPKEDGHGTA